MAVLTRRRFVAITAAATALAGRPTRAADLQQWRGIAMGADATITLAHPDPTPIIEAARAEISRLEAVFSLYRADSDLSRLNADGRLDNPPFELLECLSWCDTVHSATDGLFDPTIQPLWVTYAEHHSRGRAPTAAAIANAIDRTGWPNVRYDPTAVTFTKPGMALTLNGIAQGYIADRVAALLEAKGLTDILVDTGEYRALGRHPTGGDWPITLVTPDQRRKASTSLQNAALATSAPLGTTFDQAGEVGHILDPATDHPVPPRWQLITIEAPKAALADALSTAMCLMTRQQIEKTLSRVPSARLVLLSA
jgi:FAD:protein FMN transferase